MTTPHVWSRIGRWPTVIGRSAKTVTAAAGLHALAPLSSCYERPLVGHEQRVWVVRNV